MEQRRIAALGVSANQQPLQGVALFTLGSESAPFVSRIWRPEARTRKSEEGARAPTRPLRSEGLIASRSASSGRDSRRVIVSPNDPVVLSWISFWYRARPQIRSLAGRLLFATPSRASSIAVSSSGVSTWIAPTKWKSNGTSALNFPHDLVMIDGW